VQPSSEKAVIGTVESVLDARKQRRSLDKVQLYRTARTIVVARVVPGSVVVPLHHAREVRSLEKSVSACVAVRG
jgi:hypothetical protein